MRVRLQSSLVICLQLEACLRLGVDVDDLYAKPAAFFIERAAGHKPHLAKVLAEHYDQTRREYVADVKAERKRITAELQAASAASGVTGTNLADMERAKIAAQAAAAVENERKRMEMIKQVRAL